MTKFLELLTSWVLRPNIGLIPSLKHIGFVICKGADCPSPGDAFLCWGMFRGIVIAHEAKNRADDGSARPRRALAPVP
jgi:hypothetical protein